MHRHQQSLDDELKTATGKRLNFMFLLIFVALAILVFRLSFLQLSQGDFYLKEAETNRFLEQTVPAPRGRIYDRDRNLLVHNKPSFTITYTILDQDEKTAKGIAELLAPVLKKEQGEVLQAMDLKGQTYMLSMARKLMTDAKEEQIAFIREHQEQLPGVNVIVEPIREYLYGPFASHILGYLNNIPQDTWEKHKDEYQPTDRIGMAGVEKAYEKELRGHTGKVQVEVNIYNQPMHGQRVVDPIKGYDLILSLDKNLQTVTEKALADRVQALSRRVPTVKHAAAIAMNPKTGEIYAMASYPQYDPNRWNRGLTEKEYVEQFQPAEMNRAIQQVYQPGSTIKMASVLIGLKKGVITPHTVIHDPGQVQVGYIVKGVPNYIKSWKPMGSINSFRALAESSNVYMIKTFLMLANYREDMSSQQVNRFLSDRLPKTMNEILRDHAELGLGETKTGIDLPYEAEGHVTQEGLVSDLAFAAIGQTEAYTLLQMAQYVSTIADDGKRMQPHVVKALIDPITGREKKIEPVLQHQVSFSMEHIRAVQQGMYDVTNKPYGTFYSVFGSYPVKVAGKTGTAETGRGTENSVFVGYAPYGDPEIAIAVIVPDNERQSHSTEALGPIAKVMMDAYFAHRPTP
jgi:penicillin-binding protein 2